MLITRSPQYSDFMGNRNNRFTNPEAAGKNRIAPPAKVLHFFNAPHSMTEDDIISIFRSQAVPLPSGVKMFQSKTERSSSGLIQFESIAEAVEALVYCNHISIPNPSECARRRYRLPRVLTLFVFFRRQIPIRLQIMLFLNWFSLLVIMYDAHALTT